MSSLAFWPAAVLDLKFDHAPYVPIRTHVQNIPTGTTPISQPTVPDLPDRKWPKASDPADKTMNSNASIRFTTLGP